MIIPEMNIEHENFITVYSNVYPEGYCQHLINEFERMVKSGAGSNRQQSEGAKKHIKNDMQLNLNMSHHAPENFENEGTDELFFKGLQRCYDDYAEQYSELQNSKIKALTMKAQRTDPGGGYHIWHSEQSNGRNLNRVVVYALYLNTLDEKDGGETEYLYQKRRIRPVENTMVLWPAGFTHPHRGNTVLGEKAKYIVTGWFYYE
jgi:hypothetical protein